MKQRVISFLLITLMIFSSIPTWAFYRFADNVSNNTITLPIENNNKNLKTNAASVVSPTAIVYGAESGDVQTTGPFYVPKGATSFIIYDIGYFDSDISSSARIQVLDSENNVITTTDGKNMNAYLNENGYCISFAKFYCLEEIPAGTYSMQIVDEHSVINIDNKVIVTSDVIIDSAYINNLSAGFNEFYVNLNVLNFYGYPDDLSIKLIDENNNEIASDIDCIFNSLYNGMSLEYIMQPASEVIEDDLYSIQIIYNGDGEIISNTDSISENARPEPNLKIDKVYPKDASKGFLTIETSFTNPEMDYIVTIYDYDDSLVFKSIMSPDSNGVFDDVQVKRYGAQVPLSEFNELEINIKSNDNDYNQSNFFYRIERIYNNFYKYVWADPAFIPVNINEFNFCIEARNMLLDIYEMNDTDINITLKNSSDESIVGDLIPGSFAKTPDSEYDDSTAYEFSGTIKLNEALTEGGKYYLMLNDEFMGMVTATDTKRLYSLWYDEIYFDFGKYRVDAGIINSSGNAKLQVLNNSNEVIAESNVVSGNKNNGGYFDFTFEIDYNTNFIDKEEYTFKIIDEDNVFISEETTIFNGEKVFDEYLYIYDDLYVGDSKIHMEVYTGGFKNITIEDIENIDFNIYKQGTQEEVTYNVGNIVISDFYIEFDLILTENISFGEYKYINNLGHESNFSVKEPGTELGYYSSTDDTIQNCMNLSGSSYVGKMYNDDGFVKNISVSKINDKTLKLNDVPSLSKYEDYRLAVWEDGKIVGIVNLQYDEEPVVNEINIYGNKLVKDEVGDYEYVEEFSYFTDDNRVLFLIDGDDYSNVRYSNDKSKLSSLAYHTIRDEYKERINLSEEEGVKTVYFQFRDGKGSESEIIEWRCYLTSDEQLEIISASINPDTPVINFGTDFTVTVESNKKLCSAFAEFEYGSEDYEREVFLLDYVGVDDGNYLFEKTFNTNDYNFWYEEYYQLNLYLKSIGSEVSEIVTKPIQFGDLANILLPEFISADGIVYTNNDNYIISGYATPNATVQVKLTDNETDVDIVVNVLAGADSKFEASFTGLTNGVYEVFAYDSTLYTDDNYYLVVDNIAPVISDLNAVKTDGSSNDNVTVSWSTDDTDIAYFLLWKNTSQLLTKEDRYTARSFITTGSVSGGESYKLIAVDRAGNMSEPLIKAFGDEEPPTVPGSPQVTSRASKSVTLNWADSTDNVMVSGYEVYRNDVIVGSVTDCSYIDKDLLPITTYTYKVRAYDKEGNYSDFSPILTTDTVMPEFVNTTEILSEYIFEKITLLTLSAAVKDNGNLESIAVNFQYKLKSSETWIDLAPLDVNENEYSYTWNISTLTEGDYNFRYIVIDKDGASVKKPYEISFKHDYVSPAITLNNPAEGQTYAKEITITVDAKDDIKMGNISLYSSTDGSNYTLLKTVDEGSTEDLAVFSDIETGVKYDWDISSLSSSVYLKIISTDAYGNPSEQVVNVKIDNIPPAKPTSFSIQSTEEYIHLQWDNLVSDDDFSDFNIYRSTAENSGFELISTIDTVGYFDDSSTGVLANTNYYYYITSVDDYGNESAPTTTLTGIIAVDNTKPQIEGFLPTNNSTLMHTAILSVSAFDNFQLASLDLEYRKLGSDDWLHIITLNTNEKSEIFDYNWDIKSLASSTYQVRMTAKDQQGLISDEVIAVYIIDDYTAPVSPVLSVSNGHRSVALSWIYGGDLSLIDSFDIYRYDDASKEYMNICATTKTSYIDQLLDLGSYTYKVVAVDKFNESAESNIATGNSVLMDTENPVAVISPQSLITAKGIEFIFSASNSTDNDRIATYEWDFGDGTTADTRVAAHVYSQEGEYNVKLTVTDASGNTNTLDKEIKVIDLSEDDTYVVADISVVDAISGNPIQKAEVSFEGLWFNSNVYSDEQGNISLLMRKGTYVVSAAADGYTPRNMQISISEMNDDITIGLTSGKLITGELTATEMTLDEIKAAGIDTNDPDNMHVYKFSTTFEFVAGFSTYQLPVTLYKNSSGKVLGQSECGYFNVGGISGSGGLKIGLFPISENFWLVIYGEAHWLKEMYKVELVVVNNSNVDRIENCAAKIELPDGLSLADMTGLMQYENIIIGDIAEESEERATWYVRGDAAGEYNVSATVKGNFMPNYEAFNMTFKTSEPLKVYAGDALKLTITAQSMAFREEEYTVKYKLQNVSDKDLYNLSFGITGAEQFKVVRIGDGQAELPLTHDDFANGMTQQVGTLKPGGYIEIEFCTTIWFNSIWELGNYKALEPIGFDVTYYLTNVFQTTLEGSTTEIPYEIVVDKVHRPSLIKMLYDLIPNKDDPDFSGNIIKLIDEYLSTDNEFFKPASLIYKFTQGSSNSTATIIVNDGTIEGNSIVTKNVKITSSTPFKEIKDQLGKTKVTLDKDSDIQIKAIDEGNETITISIKDDDFDLNYEIPIQVKEGENPAKAKINVQYNKDGSIAGSVIYSDEIGEIIREIKLEEQNTKDEYPGVWFESELELRQNIVDSEILGSQFSIPALLLSDIIEKTVADLSVNSSVAYLKFDRGSLDKILQQAGENLTDKNLIITAKKINNVESFADRPAYELLALFDAEEINSFGEGNVEVSIPYNLGADEDADRLKVYYIDGNGNASVIESSYDFINKTINFSANHFSYFVIGYNKPNDSDGDSGGTGNGGSTSVAIHDQNNSGNVDIIENNEGGFDIIINTNGDADGSIEKGIKVIIPKGKIPEGVVPAIVNADGSVTIIKKSVLTDDGLMLILNSSARIILVDGNRNYTDVDENFWGIDAINFVTSRGLFQGISETEFGPQNRMTRAMLVTVLHRLENEISANGNSDFIDVLDGQWYSNAVAWAEQNNIISGYGNGIFGIDDFITREQLINILYRYAQMSNIGSNEHANIDVSAYTDWEHVSSWAQTAMHWAISNNLIKGKENGEIDPKGPATRTEVAEMIRRLQVLDIMRY